MTKIAPRPASPHRYTVRVSPSYLLAFAALVLLCGTAHEFTHHLTAGALCGCFGTITFNSFAACAECDQSSRLLATMAGPLLTFALMWLGASWMWSADEARRRHGFALVLANFPINRLLFVLLRANDEYYVAASVFGTSTTVHVVTVAIVWLVAVPPLIACARLLRGTRWAWLWFAGFFTIPFIFVVAFAGFFLEQYLLLGRRFLATEVLGVPMLMLVVGALSLAVYLRFRGALRTGGPLQLRAPERDGVARLEGTGAGVT